MSLVNTTPTNGVQSVQLDPILMHFDSSPVPTLRKAPLSMCACGWLLSHA